MTHIDETHDAMYALLKISDKIDFFQDLSHEEIEDLISNVKITSYKYGEIIFRENDTDNDHLFYLLRGKISINKYMDDTEDLTSRITTITEPSLFGEMMTFTGEPRSATVESLDNNTLVIEFQLKDFTEDSAISVFYKNIIRELSKKINKMNEQYC